MNWKIPKSEDLRVMIDSWKTEADIRVHVDDTAAKYRDILMDIHEKTTRHLGIQSVEKNEYKYDLSFGLQLYERLGLTASTAAYDKFWIYLGVCAAPEVVFWRCGPRSHDKFYKKPSRIWLKALWWYIHLSWQGSTEETRRCLEMNSTDTIVQLVERTGSVGYRIELCRSIMRQFHEYSRQIGKADPFFFRRLMKLNTARLAAMEPALCEGKEDGYVRNLFAVLESQA